jgi:hypothetical protein
MSASWQLTVPGPGESIFAPSSEEWRLPRTDPLDLAIPEWQEYGNTLHKQWDQVKLVK